VSVDEGVSSVLFVSATDEDGETPTYSITGGDDRFEFSIDSTTGELTVPTFFGPLAPSFAGNNFYQVEVSADDGSGNVTSQLITVEIVDVDVPPTLNIFGSTENTVNENNPFSLFLRAEDMFEFQAVSITLGGPDADAFVFNQDFFGLTEGTLELANFLDFENPTDADGDNIYVVDIIASDGVNEVTETITLTVLDVFESANAPVLSSASALTVNEGDQLDFTVTASDADGEAVEFFISGGEDSGFFSLSSDGTLAFATFDQNAPSFNGLFDANFDNIYEIEITATDNSGNNVRQELTVQVLDVNVAPELNLDVTSTFISENDNSLSIFVDASDFADDDIVTLTLSGPDAAQFDFAFPVDPSVSVFGNIGLVSALDFENPTDVDGDNIYEFTVVASDGVNEITQDVSITVTDVEEIGTPPSFVTSSTLSIDEGESVVGTIEATDVDGDALTYEITGGDDNFEFFLGGIVGDELSFSFPPGFDFPTDFDSDGVYEVEVTVSDGSNQTAQTFSITVNDVNTAPELSAFSTLVPEGTISVGPIDGVDFNDFNDVLTITLSGVDADQFSFIEFISGPGSISGNLEFNAPPDFNMPTDANGDNVYELTVELSDGVNTVTEDVTIMVESNDFDDGLGGPDGTGDFAPTLMTTGSTIVNENFALMPISIEGTDDDFEYLTVSISGADANAFFFDTQIGSEGFISGTLEFFAPPDFEMPTDANGDNVYEVTIELSDGVNTVTEDITITVEDDPADNGTVKTADPALSSFSLQDDDVIDLNTETTDAVDLLDILGDEFTFGTIATREAMPEEPIIELADDVLEMEFVADLLMLQDSGAALDG